MNTNNTAMNKNKRGVFWLLDNALLAVPYDEKSETGIAKSGHNYNHRLLWEHVKPKKCNRPYDYYPRGRVEYTAKGNPIIYMSRKISEDCIAEIMEIFGITKLPKIHYDGSKHYMSHLDQGYYEAEGWHAKGNSKRKTSERTMRK